MPDFSFAELAVVVVVTVIFIGPKELPVVIRAISKMMRSMRGLMHELKQAFDDLGRESGLKDTADEFEKEVRMIKGDDGKFYEAYDLNALIPAPKESDKKAGEP